MIDKVTYSVKEAMLAYGIGRTKLYQLINARELTAIKIGTRTLLRRDDLDALVSRSAVA